MNFVGSFDHAVDPKGRVVVPSQYRDDFRDGGHLSLRSDHIALYHPAGWAQFMERLRDSYNTGDILRPEFNQIMALSAAVQPDAQGRFGLPPRLRELGLIGERVVIVGVDNYLAIYRPENAPISEAPVLTPLLAKLDSLPL